MLYTSTAPVKTLHNTLVKSTIKSIKLFYLTSLQ